MEDTHQKNEEITRENRNIADVSWEEKIFGLSLRSSAPWLAGSIWIKVDFNGGFNQQEQDIFDGYISGKSNPCKCKCITGKPIINRGFSNKPCKPWKKKTWKIWNFPAATTCKTYWGWKGKKWTESLVVLAVQHLDSIH